MLDVKKCKTCKRWKDGVCQAVDETVNGESHNSNPIVFEINISVADDHNLNAELRTGPDFGCVLHES